MNIRDVLRRIEHDEQEAAALLDELFAIADAICPDSDPESLTMAAARLVELYGREGERFDHAYCRLCLDESYRELITGVTRLYNLAHEMADEIHYGRRKDDGKA